MRRNLKKSISIFLSGCMMFGGVELLPVSASSEASPVSLSKDLSDTPIEEQDVELCKLCEEHFPITKPIKNSEKRKLKAAPYTERPIFKKLSALPCMPRSIKGFESVMAMGANWISNYFPKVITEEERTPAHMTMFHILRVWAIIAILYNHGYVRTADYLFAKMYSECNDNPKFRDFFASDEEIHPIFLRAIDGYVHAHDLLYSEDMCECSFGRYIKSLFLDFETLVSDSAVMDYYWDTEIDFALQSSELVRSQLGRIAHWKKVVRNQIIFEDKQNESAAKKVVGGSEKSADASETSDKSESDAVAGRAAESKVVSEESSSDSLEEAIFGPSKRARRNRRARERQRELKEENRQAFERSKQVVATSEPDTDEKTMPTPEELERQAVLAEIIECNGRIAKKMQEVEAATFRRKKDAEQAAKREAKHQKQPSAKQDKQ